MTRNLNQDQIAILELLYRFRFASSTLLTQYLKPKNRQSINSRLDILTEQKYINKKYDKSYKLLGTPASYCLLPKAFPVLKPQEGISAKVLKNIYKDAEASEKFIEHCLIIFAISNQLEATYGNRLELFAKSELAELSHFPRPLPDAFISLKNSDQPRARTKHFFLEVFEDSMPFFVIAKRISQYSDYFDSDNWDVTGKKFPSLLAVCDSLSLQKRLQKRFSDLEDFKFCLTTKAAFATISNNEDIWQDVTEPRVLVSLSSIR